MLSKKIGFFIPKEDFFSIMGLKIQAARYVMSEITPLCAFLVCNNLL